ncbi:bacterial regulatory s, tetR family protein [Acinetobacter baumannii 25493_8]|nr:bacterial regulatory s, tetR family protein [Acinetobacter baumannii 1202252]EXC56068.1 bacterial regulatory s, tetR family protein [Acinetobacter baumannii 1032241]EXC64248.1 bacterial regulatory s, tetR family protein [Acinetobacter baumannii 1040094]EXC99007.1 bacterial regulatory s, tetR family protein [Acinetobacter baumannii 1075025]EXD27859.1 bacterial regulatory s, tetR family protein [Acinetobacter baumannii 29280]EXD43260.1 bacterial regulatory s, tetR family protein [Acinetobacte
MSRSRRSDGDLTKTKIIEAAGPLIAQYGFAKTANKTIAKVANVDLAAINYHFDGRDGLYQAVLMEAHAHYLDEQYLLELVESTYSPEEKLSLLLETLLHKLTEKDVWHGKVFK